MLNTGTQTNSLVNHLYSRSVIGQPAPTVGMGATILGWTDRSPATVVAVFNVGKSEFITVQYDAYKRVDGNGMSECQDYEYSPDLNGVTLTFRKSRNGSWDQVRKSEETGRWAKTGGPGLRIGRRERYYDFSF